MRFIFISVLLSGLGFVFIQTQKLDETDRNDTITLSNNETEEATLRVVSTSAFISETTVQPLPTDSGLILSETTQDFPMSNITETVMQHTNRTEQTTTNSVFKRTTAQEKRMTLEIITSTIVTESATLDTLPNTSLHETTGRFTTAYPTSSAHHEKEITTTTVAMTTGSTEVINPKNVTSQKPTERTESPIRLQDTTSKAIYTTTGSADTTSEEVDIIPFEVITMTSTTTQISTSQFVPDTSGHLTFVDDSIPVIPFTTGGNTRESIQPLHTNWLLIIIVCIIIVCVLLGVILVFIQWRKKNSSQKFRPGYMNGQSKKSKKKKETETDAWAGPVHLEAGEGVECEGDILGALMSADGNGNGEDVLLSTFAALETDDTPNGVGREGTEEAKKWEEQEPLLYIDEDVEEDKMGKTVAVNETEKVNENIEKMANVEKVLNGGGAFCITTAV